MLPQRFDVTIEDQLPTTASPQLDQHNADVYRGWLGAAFDEIADLTRAGEHESYMTLVGRSGCPMTARVRAQLRRAMFCASTESSNPSVVYPRITSLLTMISPAKVAGRTSPKPSVE
jgi:hypothetical protein